MPHRTIINVIGVAALVGYFGLSVWEATQKGYGDHIEYHSVTSLKPVYEAGEPLVFRFDTTRHRICKSDLDRYIIRVTDNHVVYRERVPGGASNKLGKVDPPIINELRVPLTCGKYKMTATNVGECPDGLHFVVQPEAEFQVCP